MQPDQIRSRIATMVTHIKLNDVVDRQSIARELRTILAAMESVPEPVQSDADLDTEEYSYKRYYNIKPAIDDIKGYASRYGMTLDEFIKSWLKTVRLDYQYSDVNWSWDSDLMCVVLQSNDTQEINEVCADLDGDIESAAGDDPFDDRYFVPEFLLTLFKRGDVSSSFDSN